MALIDEVREVIAGEADDSPQTREELSRDASLYRVTPELAVYPKSAADIEALVSLVRQKKEADPASLISLTPRAAGTDMSGGPLTDSIVVATTKYLNRVLEIGKDYAVTEPGVFFRDFDRETKAHGLELPSYTASREINTVGGMVGNDSGGEKNLKFGKTARYVSELDVVLSDGKTHTLRALSGEALRAKLAETSFEGELYRRMSKLLGDHRNREAIAAGKPAVSKNSSGYPLWEIGDGISSLDLCRLMVGAQGTLGIVTKIRFKLVRPKPYSSMTVLFLDRLADLAVIVPEVLAHDPDSFESYDDHTFGLAARYFPEFVSQMKASLLTVGISFLPELYMIATGGVPKLVLMVEFRADTQEEALGRANGLLHDLKRRRPNVRIRVAQSEREAQKYWLVRRESFNLLRKKIRGKRTAPFIDDFVVPPSVLPDFLPKLEKILEGHDLIYTVAGHVGDGNFHIIPLIDPKRPDARELISSLSHSVYDLVLSYKGSISGEHNDGIVRTQYVRTMFGPDLQALFAEVKGIFDPLAIFNPGKKVASAASERLAQYDLPAQQAR